jgi:endonuclease/exonuclease/phosphatase family metal-dependent hydrolase
MPKPNPSAPSNVTTLVAATANVLNLALPNRQFYANQDPYSQRDYERKIDWLGGRIAALNADILTVQEVWDEAALKAAVNHSGLRYSTIVVPGAENTEPAAHAAAPTTSQATAGQGNASAPSATAPAQSGAVPAHSAVPTQGGAVHTPRVGLITRLEVERLESLGEFPTHLRVQVPELGEYAKFERPPLLATLRMKHGQRIHVLTAHLKSKRPKFLQDAQGTLQEDREDENTIARATLRSLMIRGAEAAALRAVVVNLLQRTHEPLIVMGDFNDGPHSVTTQMIAATNEVAYDKGARDTALFNAYEEQGEMALKKDVAYSHVHQGFPEVLDQILVSEEFLPSSRFSIGDVRRVDYFNDHLQEGKDRSRSDHGFVRAVIRVRLPESTPE